MSTLKKIQDRLAHSKENTAMLAVILGALFILLSWIIQLLLSKTPISFSGIAKIHNENPVLYLVDLFPIAAVLLILLIELKRNTEKHKFDEEITEREKRMDAMADFAKQIGEGNFKSSLNIDAHNNVLAQSLLLMRENLAENHKKETEQSWIAEGKEIVSDILRIHNRMEELSLKVIHELVKYMQVAQGALYLYDEEKKILRNVATYAYNRQKFINQEFKLGHGLIGECAYEMDYIYRTEVPDDYATITSGILGEQKPQSILLVPLISDEKLQGVIEFASIHAEIPELTIRFLKELGEVIARTIFNLRVNQRTEQLLQEAQLMTRELQENEEQLRQNAEEMRATQEELQKSNEQLEANIQKVENAQKRLHSLLENASEIISIYNKDFELVYISPSVSNILGYSPDEMMSGKDMDRLTRKGEQAMREMFKQIIDQPKKPVSFQYTYMKKNGQKIFLETTGRNLLHDSAIN
jgi:PAS domain S-box-containing protein